MDGLVVEHEGTVGMLESGVGGHDCIVQLNNSSLHEWGEGVDSEFRFVFPVVQIQFLQEKFKF